MKMSWLRWKTLAVVAFLMGLPLVDQANASDGSTVFESSMSLTRAIIDAAGNS